MQYSREGQGPEKDSIESIESIESIDSIDSIDSIESFSGPCPSLEYCILIYSGAPTRCVTGSRV